MEQLSRMAAEVNKLIGNSLLTAGCVYLPEVGSLVVKEHEGSKRVEFSSAEQGRPLVEVIQERAGCSAEQASEIYRRWREEISHDSITPILGVGELRTKSFVTNESFLKQLNPKPTNTTTPMAEYYQDQGKSKKSNKGVIIFFVALFLIGAVIGFFAQRCSSKSKAEKARIEAIAQEKAQEQQRIADSLALAEAEANRLAEAETAAADTSPRYRVVYGVYTLRSNVDVAIKRINAKYGNGRAKEYPFGEKTLVSMFESESRSECQKFLMEYYELYPDTWIYDSKQ